MRITRDRSTFVLGLAIVVLVSMRPLPANACPPWKNGGETVGHLAYGGIVESSGLAASRRHSGLFWTHNDSGNGPKLYLFDENGSHRAVAHLLGAESTDWEAMAIGACDAKGDSNCVYVADIGDNAEDRESVTIYRFREPELPEENPGTIGIREWESIEFTYPEGPRNAETLLSHPRSGRLFVIEKSKDSKTDVYEVPNRPTSEEETVRAKRIGSVPIGGSIFAYVTGGDIGPKGREFSIRTYVKVYTLCAEKGESFDTAFDADPVVSHPKFTFQSEALAYGLDGDSIWYTSEGKKPPLVRMERETR